ncbi:ABC transporter permease [Actinoplanes sp. NBRC 103695]|uniref:ABC transporter permease n=1 Tax=Actinoplanes sp. NBRC 103695 TaxID=3032202 RepID=UPI0024A4F1CD|nr:ABC transporter permease [Actinoplanes sp. NBRC 103695]GLZ00704.1 transport permease protein [Actinoplanes sp. NBRC 103695]
MTTDLAAGEAIDFELLSVLDEGTRPRPAGRFSASVSHLYRAALRVKHSPAQIIDVTLFPAIMLLMFTFLFGGALAEGGTGEYLQFFLPGVLVTTVLMITMYVGMGLSSDAEKGVFDRFRSLPLWRPAAIVGPLLADAARYTAASIMMLSFGFVLGYRPGPGGAAGIALAVLLLIVCAFCMSWLWTLLGLVARSERTVTTASMTILMPLTFTSNVYVDPSTMPGWLQAFVGVNPISHLVTAVRGLMGGTVTTGQIGLVLAEAALVLAVFGPLTMRVYRRRN